MEMADYGFVGDRVHEALARVAQASRRAGRSPEDVSLLAVTKFHPVEAVLAAYDAGVRVFGENRVQEAQSKYTDFLASRPDACVHMIGHLQGNKVKKAVELFRCVESVDTREILQEIAKRAADSGRRVDILLELHTGEQSKSGFPDRGSILEACSLVGSLPSVRLRGLMTMAPFTDDSVPVRASFRELRSVFEEIASSRSFPDFDTLSMGMSNDFEIAVEEGSTLLRLGTILFGPRSPG